MTTTKQNTSNSSYSAHKFFPWALNRFALFLRMRIFKRWFNRFFFCSGMKIEFLLSTGINLYSFGHKERVDLFVCFPLKYKRTRAFSRTVSTIVIAHTLCAFRDTRISYR